VRAGERLRAGRLAGPLGAALLAFAYSLWAIVGAGRDAVFWGFLLLLAGVPVYAWLRRRVAPGG